MQRTLCCWIPLGMVIICLTFLYFARESDEVIDKVKETILVLPTFEEGNENLLQSRFNSWANAYGKQYNNIEEKKIRLNNFANSLRLIDEHNSKIPEGSSMYRLGLNQFADLTDEEFFQQVGLGSLKGQQECSATSKNNKNVLMMTKRPVTTPDSIDWREKGIVSPVKNQGHCGSCWTFSTTGALEAAHKQKTGRFVSLSEQQLLDCAGNYDNHGCNGGLPSHAFQYLIENGGLDTEKAYPYEAKDGPSCRKKKFIGVGVRVKASHNITQFDEVELEVAVGEVGPVSVAFQVASDFRLYTSGVYDSKVCQNQPKDVNHAVLAVGYGTATEDGRKYWIIKNSWGSQWGDNGYFKMTRGVNMCGVSDCASYPIL